MRRLMDVVSFGFVLLGRGCFRWRSAATADGLRELTGSRPPVVTPAAVRFGSEHSALAANSRPTGKNPEISCTE
jgi:hypothetical protein